MYIPNKNQIFQFEVSIYITVFSLFESEIYFICNKNNNNNKKTIKVFMSPTTRLNCEQKLLRGCLVCVFKQPFSVFKQHFTHFHKLFHPHVFPQMFLNNNFQFLNTRTKQTLTHAVTMFCINTKIVKKHVPILIDIPSTLINFSFIKNN